jgi:excisionase family DNA binding protein
MLELEAVRAELEALRRLVLKVTENSERPRLYEFKAAAKLLGVAPKTVSRMVASGEILTVTLRGKRLVPVEEIDRVSSPPRMTSSGATEQQARFDGAKALAELKALRAKRR